MLLSILKSNNATSSFTGMSANEIATVEHIGCKENTIYKQLKEFVKQGLVEVGAKDGKSLTFFITKSGLSKLKEARGNEE